MLASAFPRALAGNLLSWKFDDSGSGNGTGTFSVVLSRDATTPAAAANVTEVHVGVDGLHCNGPTFAPVGGSGSGGGDSDSGPAAT